MTPRQLRCGASIPRRRSGTVDYMTSGLRRLSRMRRWWPGVLGLVAAVSVLLTKANPTVVAVTVAVAGICYLGAAALNRRWVAWAGIPGGGLVVAISAMVGVPWWAGVALAGAGLVLLGLWSGVYWRSLAVQASALIGYGALAVTGTFLDPRPGLLLGGTALAAHAVWDLIHHRRNAIVPRSLAEFCMLLDAPLGAACLVIAVTDRG